MLRRLKHHIGTDEVHVWHARTDEAIDLTALQPWLDTAEIARADGFRRHPDRELFVLSRAVMRSVLASYLDCDERSISIVGDNHGKPMLQADRHRETLHFNLTHSRGAVALAVSRREVGIDVEDRRREVEYHALAERYFAEAEARHLRPLRDQQLRDAFFAIWTLKEAYVKAIGRGISFPLDAFCFDLDVDRLIAFRGLADFVTTDWHFAQFELSDRHRAAVAVQHAGGPPPAIAVRGWSAAFLPSSGGG